MPYFITDVKYLNHSLNDAVAWQRSGVFSLDTPVLKVTQMHVSLTIRAASFSQCYFVMPDVVIGYVNTNACYWHQVSHSHWSQNRMPLSETGFLVSVFAFWIHTVANAERQTDRRTDTRRQHIQRYHRAARPGGGTEAKSAISDCISCLIIDNTQTQPYLQLIYRSKWVNQHLELRTRTFYWIKAKF